MKKLLLLSLITIFTFSCQEYGDDGLPNSGGLVVLNPDGTKRVKRIETASTTTMDMDMEDLPTSINIVMHTDTETNYEPDSYNFITVSTISTEISGLGEMPEEENAPDSNGNTTMTTTSVFDGNLLREIRSEEEYTSQDLTINTRTVFSYENDRISTITQFENNEQISVANIIFNEDNVVVERTYSDDLLGTETLNFNVVDSLISSIIINNSYSDFTTEIALTRDSVNLTQASITRGSESLLAEYEYDDAHYFKHMLGTNTNLEQRLLSEVIGLSQMTTNTTEDQEPLLITMEAGLKGIVDLATHNLISKTVDGNVIEANNYTYDEDDYPVAFTSQFDVENAIDFSSILSSLGDTMLASLIENGMTEEEAQAQVDQILSVFDTMDPEMDLDHSGTIEYF